ncbi:SulP family inorganic anion transporter, partial [Klebsiella pneumoniae]|uniref:SulP family inorganic anion transporter n=1 Tax=Klebsiella pneumoniae TaxID=573 RepID=UPI002731DED1
NTKTQSNKSREIAGLGIAKINAGCYGAIAAIAMNGQTNVNVEKGRARSRHSTVIAGQVLILLVTAHSQEIAKIPKALLAGVMVI